VTTATTKNGAQAAKDAGTESWSLLQEIVFSQRPVWASVIKEYDLIPPHWIALQALDEPKPMGELAKALSCDNSNVTWITDRLAEPPAPIAGLSRDDQRTLRDVLRRAAASVETDR
jgi:hypothetical protein